jgi:hypothetical protein
MTEITAIGDPAAAPIFVLGCQRSGTTWLANIFDSSPDTLLFMEPFAPGLGLFPEIPDAVSFLERSSAASDEWLRLEMPRRLLRYKKLLTERSLASPRWFRIERAAANVVLGRAGRLAPWWVLERARRFEGLNLNRFAPEAPIVRKHSPPTRWVIKELRLAGKVALLRSAYPEARFVVIVRHPCGTVESMLRWFDQGRLRELSTQFLTYFERIETQRVAEPYRDLLVRARAGSPAQRLALYWRINYESLWRGLGDDPQAQFVSLEELSLRPSATVRRVFDGVGLPWRSSVESYLERSAHDTAPSRSHILSTSRDAANEYTSWVNRIDPQVRKAVDEVTSESRLMHWFAPYYEAGPADVSSAGAQHC